MNERYVVTFADGQRFKFKGYAYRQAAKILNGTTELSIAILLEKNEWDGFKAALPFFLLETVEPMGRIVLDELDGVMTRAKAAFLDAPDGSKKEFAEWVLTCHKDISELLFRMYVGGNVMKAACRLVVNGMKNK